MDGSNKRGLEGQEDAYQKRPRVDDSATSPSKVLHVRNVEPNISQSELNAFVSQFGTVLSICFLSKYQQALIEMDTVSAASAVIMYTKQTPVFICGKEAHFAYSKSQSINNSTSSRGPSVETPPGGVHNILLCTIVNPSIFSITVDVIYAIMSPYGPVARIVVFNKNNTPQVLVEFENALTAAQAKQALDGKDIYAGACTLKIEFSKSQKLNVHTNTDKQRDYSNPALPVTSAPMGGNGYAPSVYNDYYRMYGGMGAIPPVVDAPTRAVLIVYGLDPNMTPERVFNIFCLYGNVAKIKILNGTKGTLVQMAENTGADFAIQHLNGITLFNQPLNIQYSKHPYIADSRHDTTADGIPAAPASRDFTNSPLNRFNRNPNANKHIYKPSTTLYFGNAPKDYNEESFAALFARLGANPPAQIKFFNIQPTDTVRDNEKKLGLMEFPTIQAATEALAFVNNERIDGHTLKLAFSNNSIHQGPPGLHGGHHQHHQAPQGDYGYGVPG